jgi:hypothetical protein
LFRSLQQTLQRAVREQEVMTGADDWSEVIDSSKEV